MFMNSKFVEIEENIINISQILYTVDITSQEGNKFNTEVTFINSTSLRLFSHISEVNKQILKALEN